MSRCGFVWRRAWLGKRSCGPRLILKRFFHLFRQKKLIQSSYFFLTAPATGPPQTVTLTHTNTGSNYGNRHVTVHVCTYTVSYVYSIGFKEVQVPGLGTVRCKNISWHTHNVGNYVVYAAHSQQDTTRPSITHAQAL